MESIDKIKGMSAGKICYTNFSNESPELTAIVKTAEIIWEDMKSAWSFNDLYIDNSTSWLSPEGDKIALSGLNTLVEVRDAQTGQLLLGLQHPAAVRQALFTPDGKRLMTRGFDEIARVFALDLGDLQALADARVTRELTEEECQQYLHLESCPG